MYRKKHRKTIQFFQFYRVNLFIFQLIFCFEAFNLFVTCPPALRRDCEAEKDEMMYKDRLGGGRIKFQVVINDEITISPAEEFPFRRKPAECLLLLRLT